MLSLLENVLVNLSPANEVDTALILGALPVLQVIILVHLCMLLRLPIVSQIG